MKKIIILAFASLLITQGLYSQEKELDVENIDQILNDEIHLRINSFSSFNIGISYKRRLKENRFLVLSATNLAYSFNRVTPEDTFNFPTSRQIANVAFEIGYEFRNKLSEKFVFYHGPNVNYSFRLTLNVDENPNIIIPETSEYRQSIHSISLPYNIGLMYFFSKNFFVTAQLRLIPSINFAATNDRGIKTNEIGSGFNFNNAAGIIAIGARF